MGQSKELRQQMVKIREGHPVLALGLMSGTSMDGIDAALIRSDGDTVSEFLDWHTFPYDEGIRDGIRSVLGGEGPVFAVERRLTDAHAMAVERLLWLAQIPPSEVAVVGFHGHTILHRPQARRTWQVGDAARLSARLGIDVVADFRTADVAAGGQGAPLVPVYHAARAAGLAKPVAVLNIGGVANVTWIGEGAGEILAFDTGPGNALIDDWMRSRTGQRLDPGGRAALAGDPDLTVVNRILAHPFFAQRPPKSLDRQDFSAAHLGEYFVGMAIEDGAATLSLLTALSAARATEYFPRPVRRWLVCGGGRHNRAIMQGLARAVDVPVASVEAAGWRGDALEAEAFAFLALRSLRGLPQTFPTTTGAPEPMCGGRLFEADSGN